MKQKRSTVETNESSSRDVNELNALTENQVRACHAIYWCKIFMDFIVFGEESVFYPKYQLKTFLVRCRIYLFSQFTTA